MRGNVDGDSGAAVVVVVIEAEIIVALGAFEWSLEMLASPAQVP